MFLHKNLLRVSLCALIVAGAVFAPLKVAAQAQQLIDENALKKVSDHVYVIIGFPNIGIIVGNRATLVVDTGLGPRNGATVVRVAQKLSKSPLLYLTTTHFHPEHATGVQAFPENTILIRPTVQQEEMDRHGAEMIDFFMSRSEQTRQLLQDVHLRPPDILFDSNMKIDLGGVTARLFWLGPAHTAGDELIFVEQDSVLLPGDIVQNKVVPNLSGEESSAKGWIADLDKLVPLKPRFIVPDHGTLGDTSLIAQERAFLVDLLGRALELKSQGKSVDEAAKLVEVEFKSKYPDWTNNNYLGSDTRQIYADSK